MIKVICKLCREDTAKPGFKCAAKICPYDQFEYITTIAAPITIKRETSGCKAPRDKQKQPTASPS